MRRIRVEGNIRWLFEKVMIGSAIMVYQHNERFIVTLCCGDTNYRAQAL
jgi:hypothetical protein